MIADLFMIASKSANFTLPKTHTVFSRDSVYIVSQALGHNRLEVAINHYF